MSEKGYDLRKSLHSVKHLYPVLKDSHGNVIDGFHRLEADGDWSCEIYRYPNPKNNKL